MEPAYDLNQIRFMTDWQTFQRGMDLYEKGKVTEFEEVLDVFAAVVIGTEPYPVHVSIKRYGRGRCTCFVGQKEGFCKHMVAVMIRAVTDGKPIPDQERMGQHPPGFSGRLGTLSEVELGKVKQSITAAIRYIKPYHGPSRVWSTYQNSLLEGCSRLSAVVCNLPVGPESTRLLVDLLLRLDRKLVSGGVDDSNAIVSGFMGRVTGVLVEYARLDPACVQEFKIIQRKHPDLEWKWELLSLLPESDFPEE
jgi:hypothetical protein